MAFVRQGDELVVFNRESKVYCIALVNTESAL